MVLMTDLYVLTHASVVVCYLWPEFAIQNEENDSSNYKDRVKHPRSN